MFFRSNFLHFLVFFFQIQVHTDANEAIGASPIPATDLDHSENNVSHGDWWCQQCNDNGEDDDRDDTWQLKSEQNMINWKISVPGGDNRVWIWLPGLLLGLLSKLVLKYTFEQMDRWSVVVFCLYGSRGALVGPMFTSVARLDVLVLGTRSVILSTLWG